MIKQECIGIPDMIILLLNFFVSKKIKIKAEIVLSPGWAYFVKGQLSTYLRCNAFLSKANKLSSCFACQSSIIFLFFMSKVNYALFMSKFNYPLTSHVKGQLSFYLLCQSSTILVPFKSKVN